MLALLLAVAATPPGVAATNGDEPPTANAAPEDGPYLFQTVGLEYGLPATATLAAIQTRDGYLWVATPGGLARFDGVRFTVFRSSNTPAFSSHSIRCLCETRDGRLWIGTDRGVIRYGEGEFERVGLEGSSVTAIVEDRTGTVWIGTYGQGLHAWSNGQWQHAAPAEKLGSHFVHSLCLDSNDRLWIGFERYSGAVVIDHGKFSRLDAPSGLDDRVQAICEQPQGTLWFATRSHGLFRLRDGALRQFTTADGLISNEIANVQPSADGGLWVLGDVLQHVDLDSFRITRISRSPDDRANYVLEDSEGSAWLCTPNDYLIRLRKRPYGLIAPADDSAGQQVRSVTEDAAGNVWFVLYRHGLMRAGRDGTMSSIPDPPNAAGRAQTVFAARDGTIWMTDGLLHAWREGKWTDPFPALKRVHTIFEDRHDRMWFATEGGGVQRLANGRLEPVRLTNGRSVPNTATSFSEAPDGTVYLGLWQEGLVRLRADSSTLFNHASGMPGDEVRAVYADADGRVWVGLKDHGLAVLEHDVWLYSAALSEAVADNIRGIIEDTNGRLWLATPLGVMSAAKDELLRILRGDQPVSSLHLASVDDLSHVTPIFSGAQPVAWKASDHRLLFAGRDGVVVVDPARLPVNGIAPPVHIERVLVDRRPAARGADVTAAPGTRVITFDYTAPSFVRPDRVFFKYKLEGFDRDWVDAGTRRTVSYTHLAPGAYVFRVKACNSDGVWNALGDRVAVLQQPYFYQTIWFYAAMFASVLALIVGLHKWRTTSLRRENERLETGIADRTRELALANRVILERTRELESANNAKSEFLETVSHEIRNPLHGLNGLLGLLKRERLGGPARELADSVQACARGLTRVFEEVLGFAKLEHGSIPAQVVIFSLRDILGEVVASFAWQAQQQRNTITLSFPPDFVDGFSGDAGKIKTIASNFLGNAIKYAPGQPIELNVEHHPGADGLDEIHLEVRDHGPGIPAAEQELIFKKFVRGSSAETKRVAGTGLGLATCRVLASALQGHVGVDSNPGDGATFYLCVPLQRAALPGPEPVRSEVPPGTAGTMLIVDDEQYNQLVLRGAGLELGYSCEIAGTADQVAAAVETRSFDVILLDWELPGAKGDEVARRIRARTDGAKPIIIATTAHDGAAIRQACIAAGMDEFLFKPYHAAEVGRCIAQARDRRNGSSPAGPASASASAAPPARAGGLSRAAIDLHAQGNGGSPRASAEAFVANVRATIARLEHAIAAGDVRAIDESAHALRGLGGLIGARELCLATHEFEQRVRQGLPTEPTAALKAIIAAAAAVERDLQQLPQESPAAS